MASESILVIDDDEDVLEILDQYMLSPKGFSVLKANNGQSGLALAVKQKPDLILLDISMPYMSGLEMLQELRQTDCRSPAILMTAFGSVDIAIEAFRLGVRDYLIKPFNPEELYQVIDHAMNDTRLSKEKAELNRNLLTAEAVRVTVVTLSHYLNNYLTSLKGALTLLEESLLQKLPDPELMDMVATSRKSALSIQAVMKILLDTTDVRLSNYTHTTPIINIEKALEEELKRSSYF